MPGALRHRNFRLFFVGQAVSLIGTWMQQVAMGWLVLRMTDSPQLLGVVGFCGQVPCFLLAPLAGVFSDRWNLRRTIVATQYLAMFQAAVLAVLVLTHTVAVWQIVFLSICLGTVTAFDVPFRQSFLIQMVDGREDLPSAIALNSSIFNGARVVGPALAGFTIQFTGEGVCFLLNALSYVAVLAALWAMRIAPREPARPPRRVLVELREGFQYVVGFQPIRTMLLMLIFVNLASIPLSLVLMPLFARDVLHGGPGTLGLLTAAFGGGALLGALRLAFRKSVLGLGRQIAWAAGLFGAGIIAFSLSRSLWLSMPLLVGAGFMVMLCTAACNTVVQTIVDDTKRGRVMSFYAMAFFGIGPLGNLLAGWLAGRFGAPPVAQIGGMTCLAAAAYFALRLPAVREHVRPIYRKMGILPDVSSGIATVADVAAEGE